MLATVTMSLDDCMLGILSVIGLSDKDIVSVGLFEFEEDIIFTGLEEDMYGDISILKSTDIAILEFDVESMNMDDEDGEIDSPELVDETEDDRFDDNISVTSLSVTDTILPLYTEVGSMVVMKLLSVVFWETVSSVR